MLYACARIALWLGNIEISNTQAFMDFELNCLSEIEVDAQHPDTIVPQSVLEVMPQEARAQYPQSRPLYPQKGSVSRLLSFVAQRFHIFTVNVDLCYVLQTEEDRPVNGKLMIIYLK